MGDLNFESNAYIYASTNSLCEPHFKILKSENNGYWEWVRNEKELEEAVDRLNPRYIFFVYWSYIVPKVIWGKYECVCFHMTDVPYGRGGSPLQNLILLGHKKTKLTALRMNEQIDAGPVYFKKELELHGSADDIYLRASELSIEMIRLILSDQPIPKEQVGLVVQFNRRNASQSVLPSSVDIEQIYDFIRMLDANGYPKAFLEYGNFQLLFSSAKISGNEVIAQVSITKRLEHDEKSN